MKLQLRPLGLFQRFDFGNYLNSTATFKDISGIPAAHFAGSSLHLYHGSLL